MEDIVMEDVEGRTQTTPPVRAHPLPLHCQFCGGVEAPQLGRMVSACHCYRASWHVHCLAWYMMMNEDLACTGCARQYDIWPVMRYHRGSFRYWLLDSKRWWKVPYIPVSIPCFGIFWYVFKLIIRLFWLREVYSTLFDIQASEEWSIIRGGPFQHGWRWFEHRRKIYTILIQCWALILIVFNIIGDYFWYRSIRNNYIVFNQFEGLDHKRCIALDLTETKKIRNRFDQGQEPELMQWFHRQHLPNLYGEYPDIQDIEIVSFWTIVRGWVIRWVRLCLARLGIRTSRQY